MVVEAPLRAAGFRSATMTIELAQKRRCFQNGFQYVTDETEYFLCLIGRRSQGSGNCRPTTWAGPHWSPVQFNRRP